MGQMDGRHYTFRATNGSQFPWQRSKAFALCMATCCSAVKTSSLLLTIRILAVDSSPICAESLGPVAWTMGRPDEAVVVLDTE